MNKKQFLDTVRKKYPNIPALKKRLAKYRLNRVSRLYLPWSSVAEAEQNPEKKALLADGCRKNRGKYYAQTERLADKILKDAPEYQSETDKEELKTDMMFCRFAYGFQPDEYLCFELKSKSAEERREYVSDLDRYRYVYRLNDLTGLQGFNNKWETYKKFSACYKREAVYINGKNDREAFNSFIKKHPRFVRKPALGGMGGGVSLVDLTDGSTAEKAVFEDIISHGPHILEEPVVQGKAMAALNPSSVNTVRCVTFNTKNGIAVPYCFMKIGREGSFVDNGMAGGILVGIDTAEGKLNSPGYDELNRKYDRHPDSNAELAGYQLPEWQSMLEICREMSEKAANVKFIGWDMAYTDSGWVVIEGNGMSQLIGPQIVQKRGIKAEVEEIIKNTDLLA